GSLNDEQLRTLDERLRYLRNLEEKKAQVLSSIEEQGKLTEELRLAIENAETQVAVDDLYRPYRPKKRTRAMAAREKGLEPLTKIISEESADRPILEIAEAYISDKEGLEVPTAQDALNGAMDIVAEDISDNAEYRTAIRSFIMRTGTIVSEAKAPELDERKVYEAYYDYEEQLSKCPGHRILALNRGEKEKILSVKVGAPDEQILSVLRRQIIRKKNPYTEAALTKAISDSYKRLIFPAIEREIRNALTEKAEDGAIKVFGKNLTQLLMQPPIAGKVVLGWDPAFRTGCKLAVVDETGKVLDTCVIYPTAPQNKVEESKKILTAMIKKYGVELISVGNGTASRESEQVIVSLIKDLARENVRVQYVIVNEAGASVYSASKLATEEFPEFDVGQRSAASIARRLQDPLAELVKIEPKSIGVGQYQHDMDEKKLSEALSGVVEDAVNHVGVDLNTASAPLLSYVSGVSKTVAQNIVRYRESNGRFRTRRDLLKVEKLGPKAYEQCAGFLRLRDGAEALDATGVHPESYQAAKTILKKLGFSEDDLRNGGIPGIGKKAGDVAALAEEIGTGRETTEDILKELERPGRDPRSEMPAPILKSDVLRIEDLREGMRLKGTVRNVIDFGAFVDIGVHQDGLVHISNMTDKYIKHPSEVVKVGDIVDVTVLSVDVKRNRIGLTMKKGEQL
ncbi:MAG: RNA-binding transcriptional accessory protein, partial [Lachnospiraceae bacterium]|nr:RNA-binding transcriptional accessory protein [Lachnospiraceae bacterium]